MINQSTLHKSIYFIAKDLKHNLQALLKIQYFWHSFKKKRKNHQYNFKTGIYWIKVFL